MRAGSRFRAARIWLALSVGILLLAAYLTAVVTAFEGGPYIVTSKPDAPPSQTLALFAPTADATVDIAREAGVAFFTRLDPDRLYFSVRLPEGVPIKLMVDNLAGPKACSSPRSSEEIYLDEKQGGGINVTFRPSARFDGDDLVVVEPKPGTGDPIADAVVCEIKSPVTPHTFTQRTMTLSFDSDPTFIDAEALGLAGYAPLPGYRAQFVGIEGAEDFRFNFGFAETREQGYEAMRTLVPGTFTQVIWTDRVSEQHRDILLVVIGALIGIGVTMLIEAVRPFIEPAPPQEEATASPGPADGPREGPPPAEPES